VQSPTPTIAQAVLGQTLPSPPPAALPLLDKHGQDLVKQAAEGKVHVNPGLQAQSKTVLQALQQKDRRSVLLVSDSDEQVVVLVVALARVFGGKDAPEGLKGRRLIEVSANSPLDAVKGIRLSPEEEAAELERMRQLLAEAVSHPEVILVVPAVGAEPKQARGGQWTSLLRETLAKGTGQFICRVSPSVFTEHLRKDPIWRRQTQAVWLEKLAEGSVPREL
jgi:ATP-dependent Clp protease ATP-binding subunit ClpC